MELAKSTATARSAVGQEARVVLPHVSVANLSLILAGILVTTMIAMIVLMVLLMRGMDDVSARWHEYDLGGATKSHALSDLRGFVGLGGVIDHYRQYQMTGDPELFRRIAEDLRLARANLRTYAIVDKLTSDESQAVATISAALDEIEAGSARMPGPQMAVVDMAPAAEALSQLNRSLSLARGRLTEANNQGLDELRRRMEMAGTTQAAMMLFLAALSVWLTRHRVVKPLGRLVEQSRMLARRELDSPFPWDRGDELGHLGRTLDSTRSSLKELFAENETANRRLVESERRYAMAAAAANDGLWEWIPATGLVYFSPRLHEMLGLRPGGLGQDFSVLLDHVPAEDRDRVEQAIQAMATPGAKDVHSYSFQASDADGKPVYLLFRAMVERLPDGRILRVAGSASDITAQKFYENQLIYQASHDHLTGLRNRAYLLEWLEPRLGRGQSEGRLALLFFDLDGFKVINDTLGHSVGDQMLRAVARRLEETAAPGDLVVRLGGDEFVMVTEAAGEDALFERARRVEAAIGSPYLIDGMELSASTSIGIAIDEGDAQDAGDLLRNADIALYRAKEGGRARTEVFNTALREAIMIRHRLQSDLKRAIDHGDLFLAYQPIVALDGRDVRGFEALVRWRHPDLGLISPAQFIPIAEETGQIIPIGRFVMEAATESLGRWNAGRDGRALTVNVNLSPRQMWDDRHMDELLSLVEHTAGRVKVEVTESMTMSNPARVLDLLNRFRDGGIPLCIDDFGTGYSSLSYLTRFPFSVLKLDKSFVTGMVDDAAQERLVRGVVNLAHDLGLQVVAEGIETEAEYASLRRIGCDLGQGYLFARPMNGAEIPQWLDDQPGAAIRS